MALWVLILGGLNFSLFWWLLFISAYRLPGGVAATVNALQPVFVVALSWTLLGAPLRLGAVGAALGGVVGVALLVVQPGAALDGLGVTAGLAPRPRWRSARGARKALATTRPGPTFYQAWQLVAGGLLLAPFALTLEPPRPAPTLPSLAAFVWLGLFGAAVSYFLGSGGSPGSARKPCRPSFS